MTPSPIQVAREILWGPLKQHENLTLWLIDPRKGGRNFLEVHKDVIPLLEQAIATAIQKSRNDALEEAATILDAWYAKKGGLEEHPASRQIRKRKEGQ